MAAAPLPIRYALVPVPPEAAPGRRADRRDDRPWPSVRRTWWRHPAPCGPDRPWRGRLRPGLPVAGCAPRSAPPALSTAALVPATRRVTAVPVSYWMSCRSTRREGEPEAGIGIGAVHHVGFRTVGADVDDWPPPLFLPDSRKHPAAS
jgi:hypothetical protein